MNSITDEIISEYKNHLIDEEKSRSTIEKYLRDVISFSKWLGKRKIDKRVMLEYKEHLVSVCSPRSVNSVLSSLGGLLDYIGFGGCKVRTLKIQKQIFADKCRELTKSEYARLLRAARDMKNERLYRVMQTICSTGIRVSELKYITVVALRTGQADIRCKGKLRTVMLPKQLCAALRRYAKERRIKSGSVFVTRTGKPLDRSNIWSDMKKLCEIADVDKNKVFPHNLRHLFARTFYSLQKDIVRLADILGHSSVNTTRIYTMETGEVHRRQIEKLNLLC